jgi:hypothetical protein
MKRNFIITALLAIGIVCSSCSSEPPETSATADNEAITETAAISNNVPINPNAAALQMPQSGGGSLTGFFGVGTPAGYTFEYGSFGDNYVITVSAEGGGSVLLFTVEDNDYNSMVYVHTAPEGYIAETVSKDNCILIEAPRGNPEVPDILQMIFTPKEGGDPVSLFYGIKSRELVQLELYTTIPYALSEMAFCTDTVLIRSEDYKFIPPPAVMWDENGVPTVSVFTYTLDPNRMTLTKAAEAVTPDNTLYYSYAVLSAADDIVSMYTTKNLTAQSDTDFVSVQNAETGESERYFKINDPRFSNTEELLAFTNRYFTPEITEAFLAAAPQKYRDIEGALYAVKVTGQTAKPLSVIVDVLREDTEISVMLSGGGSVVIRPGEGKAFTVVKYTVV